MLQRDLNLLKAKVSEMARLVELALAASVKALVERNRRLAYSVILRDQYIDELEMELDRLCLEFLVRHQPAAGHLRLVFTTIQINRELERIGDYAESISRQVLAINSLEPQPPMERFVELGELATRMLREATQSFVRQDADLARQALTMEERANTLRNSINADLVGLNQEGRLPQAALGPLMTIARRLERAADQTKNLCEDVLYLCTGEFAKHKGADAFRILFLDGTNSSLSQLGEGLGHSLKLPRFHFSSAGLVSRSIDPRVVQFMAGKGIDIGGQVSKTLDQLPNWDQSQVIVVLGAEVREKLPARPGKVLLLNWSIPDPSGLMGPPETIETAFESAYRSLESNLRDLVGAILDEPQAEPRK